MDASLITFLAILWLGLGIAAVRLVLKQGSTQWGEPCPRHLIPVWLAFSVFGPLLYALVVALLIYLPARPDLPRILPWEPEQPPRN